jgi:exopolysaccharide biosynthesis polyprenyl glycosylphosphotransferase
MQQGSRPVTITAMSASARVREDRLGLRLRRLKARSSKRAWRYDALRRRMLAAADVLSVLVLAAALGLATGSATAAAVTAAFLPPSILLAKLVGLYDADHRVLRHLTVDEFSRIFRWTVLTLAASLLLLDAFDLLDTRVGWVVLAWVAFITAAAVLRALARALWRRLTPPDRVVILGDGPLVETARRKMELFSDIHADVVLTIPLGVAEPERVSTQEPDWLRDVDRVVLASETLDESFLEALVEVCRREKVRLSVVPPARAHLATAARLTQLGEVPVLEYATWDVSRSTLLLKRTIDIVGAGLGLALFGPLLALAALVVLIDDGRPIFFRQRRVGLRGRPFTMLKLRTMVVGADERLPVSIEDLPDPMFKLPEDPRTTRPGRWLRRLSIDELPQLWNVLRGDMSLVGPRPEQVELVELYAPEHRFRLSVKPGMTGPMQVSGRGDLTFEERLALERDYIENISLARDFRILALTIAPVLSGRGAT